jgi:hypothetical protein
MSTKDLAAPDLSQLFGQGSIVAPSQQTVAISYGKANFSNVLATYACMKVEQPFRRSSAFTTGVRQGGTVNTRAGTLEHHGGFISGRIKHDNGSILMITARWMRGGSPIRDGAMFLRLRHGATLWSIAGRVPTDQENVCGDNIAMFSGTADVLCEEELKFFGLDVPRSWLEKFMDEDELAECFRIVQVAPERIPRPSLQAVSTPTGIQMREVGDEPQRRLIIRRRQ